MVESNTMDLFWWKMFLWEIQIELKFCQLAALIVLFKLIATKQFLCKHGIKVQVKDSRIHFSTW